jgi:hypothetical protein
MFLRISLQFFTAGADVVVIKAVSHVTISLKFVALGGILDESVYQYAMFARLCRNRRR